MIKIQTKVLNNVGKIAKNRATNFQFFKNNHNNYQLNLNFYRFSSAKIVKSEKEKMKANKKISKDSKQAKQAISIQKVDYGSQINALLSKKDLSQTDLVFLSKMLHIKNIHILSQEHSNFIKKQLKKLPSVGFQNLIPLIQLSQKINVIHFYSVIVRPFITHFTNNKIEIQKIQAYPNAFLKQNFKKKIDQGAEVLKVFGTLMTNQELKKVDSLCCQSIKSMEINSVVRFLNIFRQIARKGLFVDLAGQIIAQKRLELSNKYLLMSLISLLQMGGNEPVQRLQPLLISRISGEKALDHKEVIAVLQVFHKFKKGTAALWQNIQKYIRQKEKDIEFQHIFAILSGLTRNYIARPSLFLELVLLQPTLDFVKDLNEKQFIEFFLVLYFHFQHSSPAQTKKIELFILQAIKSKQMKSVYLEIQNFFLFLFQKGSPKKDYLRKAYPNDMMVTLVSLAYPIQQTVDVTEAKSYEQDLMSRYGKLCWEANKKTIVAEEFIRYKLVSARQKQFKDLMM